MDLAHVLGAADASAGSAVVSTARLRLHRPGEPEGASVRARLAKCAAHEVGHALGLEHCRECPCVMSEAATLAELDARPLRLPPEARSALAWPGGEDGPEEKKRMAELLPMFTELGLVEEAARAAEVAGTTGDAGASRDGG